MYIQAWGSHVSGFHRITQNGSKIHHGSMRGGELSIFYPSGLVNIQETRW